MFFEPLNLSAARAFSIGVHAGLALGLAGLLAISSFMILSRASVGVAVLITSCAGFSLPAFLGRFVTDTNSAFISGAGALLVGLSLSVLLFCALLHLSNLRFAKRVRFFLSAVIIGLVLFSVIFYILPREALLLVVCFAIFPSASAMAAVTFTNQQSSLRPVKLDVRSGKTPVLIMGVFLLGMECVIASQMGQVIQSYQIGIGITAGLIFFVLWIICKNPLNIMKTYLTSFSLLATLLLLFPFAGSVVRGVVIFISMVVMQIMLATVMIVPNRSAIVDANGHSYRLSMLLLSSFHASAIVGIFIGEAMSYCLDDQFLWTYAFSLLSIYLFLALALLALWKTSRRRESDFDNENTSITIASVQDSFETRCRKVADDYGLSERETEVLGLIMRGRDVPTIAEKLSISQNTVRFHMKNLYQALGVHSKQDLIAITEDCLL